MAGVKFAGEEAVERIAHYVNKKLNIASTMPSTPNDEDIILYTGDTNESYIQGCIYEYDEINEKWKIINSVQTVELTTEEYELLPVSVQNNGTIYFLTDGASSQEFALKSEGYAIGEQNGVPVTSGSLYYENNAKYWAQWTANAIGIALNTEY